MRHLNELEQYIQSYFGVVNADDIKAIVQLFEPKNIKKNEVVLTQGERCTHLSFVQSGLLRVFAKADGKEVTQWISTKGYFTTDLASFMFDTPARWTIQALENTELYSISKSNYLQIAQVVPKWTTLEKLFLVRCFTMLEDRIFSHLSMTAEERYAFLYQQNKELFNLVPLQYIASMIGMAPETLSRIRKKQLN